MSEYVKTLSAPIRERYYEKLKYVGLEDPAKDDPYLTDEKSKSVVQSSTWIDDVSQWPSVEFGDIYTYFVNTPGPYTRDTMQAYRSLDAYVYYIDGWVQTCFLKNTKNGYSIIKAKVNRSQAVTQDPHRAWVAVRKKDKLVEFGHCTCMAGLGEVCSHVAAILFKVEAGVRLRAQLSCTDEPCKWNQTFVKKVEAVPLAEITFDNPKKMKSRAEFATVNDKDLEVAETTELLADLRQSAPNAVIFTVTSPKKSKINEDRLPPNLANLYDEKYRNMDSGDFSLLCEKTFKEITSSEAQNDFLEEHTRKQSKSFLWHKYRTGRLTSSNFHEAARTNIKRPSTSLVKKIVYGSNVNTKAVKWGCENESVAVAEYTKLCKQKHSNVKVISSGFYINKQYPYLGSSPDGIIVCDCCGKGTVEVKCPYKFKDINPCLIDSDKFCLKAHEVCDNSLKHDHPYFYQVQGQMGICGVSYCDFVCYTSKGIHIERILFDQNFFNTMIVKVTDFYRLCIVPELLARRLKNNQEENAQDPKRSKQK